ncbi:MAG TPA: hypothetical protein VMJ64_17145, partial [Anaerolineales bacterium]|nr:hypothetical protein [Anaerolineales bacterium]
TASAQQARTAWGDPVIEGIWTFAPDKDVNPVCGDQDVVNGCQEGDKEVFRQLGLPPERLSWPGSLVRGTPDRQIPYQPWARAKQLQRKKYRLSANPPGIEFISTGARCLSYGVPSTVLRPGFHVWQFPTHILMIWEQPFQMHRIIWTDGRAPPGADVKLLQGFSVGRWAGNVLRVTTTNSNGFPWMGTVAGDFYSEHVRQMETFTVLGPNQISYRVEIEDPTVYTQPWWMEWHYTVAAPVAATAASAGPIGKGGLSAGMATNTSELWEVACVEGDRSHYIESVRPRRY